MARTAGPWRRFDADRLRGLQGGSPQRSAQGEEAFDPIRPLDGKISRSVMNREPINPWRIFMQVVLFVLVLAAVVWWLWR
jgi:hypothetical protein